MKAKHPQPYDRIGKEILHDIKDSLIYFITGITPAHITPINIEFPRIQSRSADMIFKVRLGKQTKIFHIELQSDNDPDMAYRMLRYANEILHRYKWSFHQCVLYFGKDPVNMTNQLNNDSEPDSHLTYSYQLLKVGELKPESWLNLKDIHLLPFLPLMKMEGKPESYLNWCLEVIVKQVKGLDKNSRNDLLFKTKVLCGLRYERLVIKESFAEVEKMLSLKDNPVIQEILEEGVEIGLKQGVEQGVDRLRKKVIEVLTRKFHTIPMGLIDDLKKLTDFDQIDLAFTNALECQSLEEFHQTLR